MGADSNIEWTDHTFNPWRGCTKVSPGCANCYAEKLSKRNPGVLGVWGPKGRRVVAAESYWRQPLKWNREAAEAGERRRVFCASLADVFEGPESMRVEDWPLVEAARLKLFAIIAVTPHLDWQLLTKRPENAGKWLMAQQPRHAERPSRDPHWYHKLGELLDEGDKGFFRGRAWNDAHDAAESLSHIGSCLPNVWLGTSVEDQRAADERVPLLLAAPAVKRFLSCEPLLGPVDLLDRDAGGTLWMGGQRGCDGTHRGDGSPGCPKEPHHHHDNRCGRGIDWVIAGGESGPKARPMHPGWAESLRDQCVHACVPFFFKQSGEWAEAIHSDDYNRPGGGDRCIWMDIDGNSGRVWEENGEQVREGDKRVGEHPPGTVAIMSRVGKKAAGRTLDGVTHDAVPAVTR